MNKQERWFWSVWDLKSQAERVALSPIKLGITEKSCNLYSRTGKFAKVHYLNSATIGIESKTEWSDLAGITHTSGKKTPSGWNGQPSVWWYIGVEDSLELTDILVKLLKARESIPLIIKRHYLIAKSKMPGLQEEWVVHRDHLMIPMFSPSARSNSTVKHSS